ncbi:monofunctional biosynthetic peptidoglycan transglycosylase [Pelagibius sp. Alg239-R121]|uniref:monofunctional biosynthetic peptidoglycan transglycosylase n=1 Tax=Pelagibius sp. Alg239-R121 TaxID=2993448 RepID=UPI0024A6DB51|nr:monofunctional biosynthetic peptidoglycan transglycosylase [Pelagibius sp. Alg239-R121]
MKFLKRLGKKAFKLLGLAVLLVAVLVLLFRIVPVPFTPLMLLRDAPINKRWVPLTEISPALPRAVIAAEDNLFCSHWGFDLKSLQAAAVAFASGEKAGGGSTISMQTAKNLFLWPKRSVVRKLLEAPLTLAIEATWPKTRILEVYLNVAEWAPGVYGAEAAARHHFGKSAKSLTRTEAARLAAVLPSPLKWSAGKPGNYVRRRTETINRRVGQLGPLLDCANP